MRAILLSFSCLLTFSSAYAGPIVLDKNSEQIITTGFNYLEDSLQILNLKEVILENQEGKFNQPDQRSFVPHFSSYWIHFYVNNNTGVDQEWILDFQNWSMVEGYINEGAKFSLHKSGHLFPYRKRDYRVANKSYLLLLIRNGETKELYVKLTSRYNNELIPKGLYFSVAPRSLIDRKNNQVGIVIYSFLAVFAIMFLYNLFVYLLTGIRSYAYYLIVIFFAFYHTAYNSGYLIELFGAFDSFPIWLTHFETFSSTLFGMSIILFAHEFLKIKERYPFWHHVVIYIIGSYIAFAFLLLINKDLGTITTSLSGLATILTIIILSVKCTRDRFPSSGYFMIGYSSFLFSILIIILSVNQVIPQNIWTNSFALPIGSTIQIIFFSFALIHMIKVLRQQNDENQKRIIEQLKENQQLQTQVTRELEQKVQLRTAEINHQKEQIEKERELSETLLLNILPASTAKELKEKGVASPKLFPNVSILFTDFVDFTLISEKMKPEKLVEDLDNCFRAFDDIILSNKLEKIKTIGDAYMAISGAPIDDPSHAFHAVTAALQIRSFIEKWNLEKTRNQDRPWGIRLGIHSGAVIGGVVGKNKFAFDIWGDAVNTASRMESSGESGKINISGATYALIKNYFICSYRGKIKAKNKGEIDMYFVMEKEEDKTEKSEAVIISTQK